MIECPNCQTRYDFPVAFCGTCGAALNTSLPPADPLIGMVIGERYKIINLIGRGGMGAVYRVEHVKMGKIMAMKLLHGELSSNIDVSRRFSREAKTVSKLSHINTVSVFDFGSHQGMMYLVMEYIEGRDLSDLLRCDGAMPPIRVLDILAQVCASLKEAHGKGIVHRDLKPANIIVTQSQDSDDFVKVLDFGLAKLRDQETVTRITQQGSLVGTPYYMAPEHIRGEEVDARSDIYALGAVMFTLLTNEVPFFADTPMGIITRHLTEDVKRPSELFPNLSIPKVLDDIVLKAMWRDPQKRYKSAEEMRLDLISARTQIVASHKSVDLKAPAQKTPMSTAPKTVVVDQQKMIIGTRSDVFNFETSLKHKRRWHAAILIAFVLLGLSGSVYWYLFHVKDNSDPTRETEPNNSPSQADTLIPTVQLAAVIADSTQKGDVDWYKLVGPPKGEWAVEAIVTGVAQADLAIQLVDPDASKPLAVANEGGPGKAETIHPTIVNKPSVYLMVQEVRRPGVPPGDFPNTPYGVVYRMYSSSSVEREPNNRASTSTAAMQGVPLLGRLSSAADVDWFCVPAGPLINTVRVTGPSGVDIQLEFFLGPGGKRNFANNALVGLGEFVNIPQGPGPVCAAVKPVDNNRADPNFDWASNPYQIVFQ